MVKFDLNYTLLYINKDLFLYLCSRNFNLNTYLVMARPIKETPILYGEDARRFEARMKEHRRF